jgi:hypothetical protein
MSREENSGSDAKLLHPSTKQRVRAVRLGLSLDGWAVVAAIALAVLVRCGVMVRW